MLSEKCINALIDDLNDQDVEVTYGGGNQKTINVISVRAQPMSNVDSETRVSIQFVQTDGKPKSLSAIASHDPDTNVVTFGFEEVTQVDILVSAKAATHGVRHINPRTVTAAIMNMVITRVLKYWNPILKLYNGSLAWERGYTQQDLTPFIQADNRSERRYRFWIKHEFTYNVVDDADNFFAETEYILWYLYDTDEEDVTELSVVHEEMYD